MNPTAALEHTGTSAFQRHQMWMKTIPGVRGSIPGLLMLLCDADGTLLLSTGRGYQLLEGLCFPPPSSWTFIGAVAHPPPLCPLIGSLRLEKTNEVIQSNHRPISNDRPVSNSQPEPNDRPTSCPTTDPSVQHRSGELSVLVPLPCSAPLHPFLRQLCGIYSVSKRKHFPASFWAENGEIQSASAKWSFSQPASVVRGDGAVK